MYKDKQGNPIDAKEWARLLEDPDYRVIGQTTVGATLGAALRPTRQPLARGRTRRMRWQ